jgi:hypothetical protein
MMLVIWGKKGSADQIDNGDNFHHGASLAISALAMSGRLWWCDVIGGRYQLRVGSRHEPGETFDRSRVQ